MSFANDDRQEGGKILEILVRKPLIELEDNVQLNRELHKLDFRDRDSPMAILITDMQHPRLLEGRVSCYMKRHVAL
jgi:hypothetical protein